MGIRAFLAIDLDAAARTAVAGLLERLRGSDGADRVRWVRPEGLHVTLRFLGDVEPEQVPVVGHHVGRETAGLSPFAMQLGAVRAFPSPRRPRAIALSLSPETPVVELAGAVERGVVAAGFPAERRAFRPHLTLGRLRDGRLPGVADLSTAAPTETDVREVVLFQSHLGPGGSRYSPLERLALGGADSSPNPSQRNQER